MLRWVSPAQAKHNEVRKHLTGILVEPAPKGGVLVVATNGHHMLIAHDASGYASKCTLLNFSRSAAFASGRSEDPESNGDKCAYLAQIKNERLVLLNQFGAEVFVQPGDAVMDDSLYPDWRKVFKFDDPVASEATLNPAYIFNMTRELPKNRRVFDNGCVRLLQNKSQGWSSAVLVQIMGYPIVGVIMPVRELETRRFGWFLEG